MLFKGAARWLRPVSQRAILNVTETQMLHAGT